MTTDDATRAGFSLRRWSARKHAAARDAATEPRPVAPVDVPAPPAVAGAVVSEVAADAAHGATLPVGVVPAGYGGAVAGTPDDARVRTGAAGDATPVAAADVALPPIESLTPQSDFTPFMRPDVDPALKRAALRKLFTDPHFNVMDGLDVYIDDYSKPDPIAPEILRTLVQARYIFDPPVTRVNAQGYVEDVPPEEVAAARAAEAARAGDAADAGASDDPVVTTQPLTPPHAQAGDDQAASAPAGAGDGTATAQPDDAQLDLPLSPQPNPVPAPQERS